MLDHVARQTAPAPRGFRAMQFNFVVATNTRAIATLGSAPASPPSAAVPGAFAHPTAGYVDAPGHVPPL